MSMIQWKFPKCNCMQLYFIYFIRDDLLKVEREYYNSFGLFNQNISRANPKDEAECAVGIRSPIKSQILEKERVFFGYQIIFNYITAQIKNLPYHLIME